jgi:hypothetical protein
MLLEKKNAVIYGAGEPSAVRLPSRSPARGQGSSLPVIPEHPSRQWLRRSPRLEEWPRRHSSTHLANRPSRSTWAK